MSKTNESILTEIVNNTPNAPDHYRYGEIMEAMQLARKDERQQVNRGWKDKIQKRIGNLSLDRRYHTTFRARKDELEQLLEDTK